jgi:hypothetical protein
MLQSVLRPHFFLATSAALGTWSQQFPTHRSARLEISVDNFESHHEPRRHDLRLHERTPRGILTRDNQALQGS